MNAHEKILGICSTDKPPVLFVGNLVYEPGLA